MRRAVVKIRSFIITLVLFLIPALLAAQHFDYESRPVLDFDFTEAQIDLDIDTETGSLDGSVSYSLRANVSGADTLELDAPGLEIDSVSSQGNIVNFSVRNGVLYIPVTDSSQIGQEFQVEIMYHASPRFGFLKSSEGTIWTSRMPRSNRHWLPVKDHPRVEMTTTISLRVPATMRVFGSGVKTDEQILSTDSKKVTFRSSRPIPITALSFGLGELREQGTSVGIKRISSYAEPGSISESDQRALVERARQILEQTEQATGLEYPYQRLHLAILSDHYWEQKPYGATTVFLYDNRGDWENQLRRGLYAQWLGVYRHETQWSQARLVHLLQSALHRQISDTTSLLSEDVDEPAMSSSMVYENFSATRWNFWQQSEFLKEGNNRLLAVNLIKEILSQKSKLITEDAVTEMWYQLSGQPVLNLPEYRPNQQPLNESAARDTVIYRVDYQLNNDTNSLKLLFNAQQRAIQQPVTVPVQIVTENATNTSEITFSGSVDSASVSLPAGTQNVRLVVPEDRNLIFEEHKPVSFLLYQLRNGETSEARRKAATQLGYHTDNPDLQLALNDLMKSDMEPEVEAALLRSYADITAGAEGTEQRFLEALQNQNSEIRAAALSALQNYEDPEVTQRLQTYSRNESNIALSNRAMKLYIQRIDSAAVLEYTNTLVQQDTAGTKAIVAIEAMAERGNVEQAVKLANFYIEPVYAYPVRKQALQILLNNAKSVEGWQERAQNLMNDFDPRMRFLTAKNISTIPGIDASAFIRSQIEQEYDARVFKVMSKE